MALGAASGAFAGEDLFGFVYTLDIQPKGSWEFEQRLDHSKDQAVGSYNLSLSRTELEYGLTNNLQLAGYVNATQGAGEPQLPEPRDL